METETPHAVERAHQLADQRTLIERARRGDASAHRALYDAHVDRIYRLTFRITGEEHLARELTQDTFVRAFAGIDGFRGESAFGTWLHTIAVSLSLNEIKRRKRDYPQQRITGASGDSIGYYDAELVEEESVIAELETGSLPDPIALMQTLNYLRASGLVVGMVVHFGPGLNIRRLVKQPHDGTSGELSTL